MYLKLENKLIELNENEKETLNGGNGRWDASMIGICAGFKRQWFIL